MLVRVNRTSNIEGWVKVKLCKKLKLILIFGKNDKADSINSLEETRPIRENQQGMPKNLPQLEKRGQNWKWQRTGDDGKVWANLITSGFKRTGSHMCGFFKKSIINEIIKMRRCTWLGSLERILSSKTSNRLIWSRSESRNRVGTEEVRRCFSNEYKWKTGEERNR